MSVTSPRAGETIEVAWGHAVYNALGSGAPAQPPTFVVVYNASTATYRARNGRTGTILFEDDDACVVLQTALTAIGAGESVCLACSPTITGGLTLNGSKTLYGDHAGRTITTTTDADVITFSNTSNMIHNLTLTSTVALPTKSFVTGGGNDHQVVGCTFNGHNYGINRNSAGVHWRVTDNFFTNQLTSAYFAGSANARYTLLANNRFGAGCASGAAVLYLGGGHNDLITGNHLRDVNSVGIWLANYVGAGIHNNAIVGNFICDCAGGIVLDTDGNFVSSNYLVYNAITGAYDEVTVTGDYNAITNNYIYQYRDAAVYCVNISAAASTTNVSYNTLRKKYAAAGYVNDLGAATNEVGNHEYQA